VITLTVLCYIRPLPFLFVGWFWYLGTLIPVIGLVQIGMQAMADRYTYLPSIGISVMLAWGIPLLFQRGGFRKEIIFSATIAVFCTLIFLTWMQCDYWKNTITLSTHALRVTKNNFIAYHLLGSALFKKGNAEEAIYHFNKAILYHPHNLITDVYVESYKERGDAYANLGQYQRAIEDYNQTIQLKPDNDQVYNNRGIAYYYLGQHQRAIEDYNQTIQLKPDNDQAYYNKGLAYIDLGQYRLAIDDFNKAISLNPIYTRAYIMRGDAHLSQGNKELYCRDIKKACELGDCKALKFANGEGFCR